MKFIIERHCGLGVECYYTVFNKSMERLATDDEIVEVARNILGIINCRQSLIGHCTKDDRVKDDHLRKSAKSISFLMSNVHVPKLPPTEVMTEAERVHMRILQMAADGYSTAQIAAVLKISRIRVMLIRLGWARSDASDKGAGEKGEA